MHKGRRNPRFVASSSLASSPRRPRGDISARGSYARGEMENGIKKCQLHLFADRTSAATMRANQLRLWFADGLCPHLRVAHTQFAAATCGTIRLALLKIGALVRISVRRVHLAMASGRPWQNEHLRLAVAC